MSDDYKIRIRIPRFHKFEGPAGSTDFNNLPLATVCSFPGLTTIYMPGDIVYVDFENDDISRPVIVGKLSRSDDNSGSFSDISGHAATFKADTHLSSETTIGDIIYQDLLYTVQGFANLVIPEPKIIMQIVAQPINYIGQVNDDVSFTVEAVGKGLTYQWQYSNNNGSTWSNSGLPGNNTATLTTTLTVDGTRFLFRCVITDEYGNHLISNVVQMIKSVTFEILAQPVNFIGLENDPASFSVIASGSNLTYQWQYSSNNGSTWGNSSLSGNKTSCLNTTLTAARTAYLFRCFIKDTTTNTSLTSNPVRMKIIS